MTGRTIARSLSAIVAVLPMLIAPQRAPAQSSEAIAALREAAVIQDLALASRILANEGVLDAYGHVSVRHPTDPNRYLMARSLAPALITPADILQFHLDSRPVKPTDRRLFTERYIHGAIYKARPDVMAVVHSHSPTVIPFGVSNVPLRPVFHLGAFLYRGVPVFEISDHTSDGEMLIRDARLGDAVAKTLGDKIVVLMRGHGNAVVGPSLQHAVFRAIYTEVNARLQTIAIGLGGPVRYLSDAEGDNVTNQQPGNIARAWELWKEKVQDKMQEKAQEKAREK
jgi:ribulose-5-phosphate 4-epimerase/fuculose-1-phosphate aldolase